MKTTEQLVEAILGEDALHEGDARALSMAMETFDHLFSHEVADIYLQVQNVHPNIWTDLQPDVVMKLKQGFERATVGLRSLAEPAKAALRAAHNWKPKQTGHTGYDSAAHSGELELKHHNLGQAD